jgi:LCP family protein required for cell wall assembly
VTPLPSRPVAPHDEDPPPHAGRGLLLRGAAAAAIITVCSALAVATAGIAELDTVAKSFDPIPAAPAKFETEATAPAVTKAEAGDARTFLFLGSDRRYADLKKNNPALEESIPARSDTMMLVRLDPDEEVTSVLSIPRDLKVEIPGHGTAKLNESYALGGPSLTSQTLQELLGIEINHILNATFGGFRKAVSLVGCVYADIDRRYFHSNEGLPVSQHYAEIDIEPGYQRLCGQKALDYVRFRHADNDLVRAARQQDFLRAMKDQISTSRLFDDRGTLLDIFTESVQTDEFLRSATGLESVLKLALFSAGKPVRQVPFPAAFTTEGEIQYVVAEQFAIDRAADRFLDPPESETPRTAAEDEDGGDGTAGSSTGRSDKKKQPKKRKVDLSTLRRAREEGENEVARTVASGRVGFPLYFPVRATRAAQFTTTDPHPRVYKIRDRAGKEHSAYRLVMVHNQIEGQYYGVQGTTWKTPPLLAKPTSTRIVNGRRLRLYRDGSRLRFVAWSTDRAVYWVSNTLTTNLSNDQMLGIAASLQRFEGS